MANTGDIENLIKLRFDYFEDENRDIPCGTRQMIESNLRDYFSRHIGSDFFAAVIEDDGAIISVAFLSIVEKPASLVFPTGKTGAIFNVYTLPEHRGKGFATSAMRTLIEEAKRQNASYIELSATVEGLPLYRKLGFMEKLNSEYTDMKLQLTDTEGVNKP